MEFISTLQALNMLLSFSAIGLLIYMCKKFSDTSTGVMLVYFLDGTLFLAAITIFTLFIDIKHHTISEETFALWQHGLFYFAMITFWFGCKNMAFVLKEKQKEPSFMGLALLSGIAVFLFILSFFLVIHPLEHYLSSTFSGWVWNTFGLLHFIAFALAGLASFYVFKIQKILDPDNIALASNFLIAFALFAAIHFWELLFENWKLIALDKEIGEIIEQFTSVLAFIVLFYAFWQTLSVLSKNETKSPYRFE